MATEQLSLKLYDYICEVSGSENVVKQRRLFFKTLDSALNSRNYSFHTISSGSKAEGLDFDGSDYDVMCIIKKYPVYVESKEQNKGYNIVVDTDNSPPGFAVLKLQSRINIDLFGSVVYTDCGILLSSDLLKTFFESLSVMIGHINPYATPLFVRHGPCISSLDMTIDIAYCLHSQTWPLFAFEWLARPRSKWPPVHLKENIKQQGILFVPIGDSEKHGLGQHEWRISFSLAEKSLMHSFNHTQLLCYATLKFVLKEIIDANTDTQSLLCSYFMKTVLFWEIESNECLIWEPQNFLECYMQCFRRLIYFVRCEYCPNYFMPENNMFKNKIFGRAQQRLETTLDSLLSEGIAMFLYSRTLKDFFVFKLSAHIGKREETNKNSTNKEQYVYLVC